VGWKSATGLVLSVAIATAACQSTAGPLEVDSGALVQAQLAQSFTLAPGEIARIGPTGPYLVFRRVTSDSRCPMDVVCVWMGDAVVALQFGLTPRDWVDGELHTDPEQPPMDAGGYRIRLAELQPYPVSSESIPPDRYRATFQVTLR
jgi:hypothetical protein